MSEIEQILYNLSKELLNQIVQKTSLTETEKEEVINKIAFLYAKSNIQEMILPFDFTSHKYTTPIMDIPIGNIKTIIFDKRIHMIYKKGENHYHAILDEYGLASDTLFMEQEYEDIYVDVRDIAIYNDKIRLIYLLSKPEAREWEIYYRDYSETKGWSKQRRICYYVSPVVNPAIKTVVKEDQMYMFHNLRPAENYPLRYRFCNGEHEWTKDDIDIDPMLGEYVVGKCENDIVVMWETEDNHIKWQNIDKETSGTFPLPYGTRWRLLNSPLYHDPDKAQQMWFLIKNLDNDTIHARRFYMIKNTLTGSAETNYTSFLESKIIGENLYIFFKTKKDDYEFITYATFNRFDWISYDEVPLTKDISEQDLKVEFLNGKLFFIYGIETNSTKFIHRSEVQLFAKIGYQLAEMLLFLKSKLQ